MDFLKAMKKQKKQMILANNRMRGRMAEENYVTSRRMQGYDVRRTGRGSDYEERKVDMWTGRRGPKTLVEVKSSSSAPVSKLQKKTKRKSSRYRVERTSGGWI